MILGHEGAKALEEMLRRAGDELRKYSRSSSLQVRHKEDDSLVTEADLASEKSILNYISQHFPADLILSEEAGWSRMAREEGSYVWIIDPLDGTTNFANGYPFYCISIARARFEGGRMRVVLGGIYDPERDRLYMAAEGEGAYLNGQAIRVRGQRPPQEGFLVTGFAYHKGETLAREVQRFLEIADCCQSIRRDGAAALDMALVAEGVYDGYWETGLKPWDLAAGALLVREAGGVASNIASPDFDPEIESIVCGSSSMVTFLREHLS